MKEIQKLTPMPSIDLLKDLEIGLNRHTTHSFPLGNDVY